MDTKTRRPGEPKPANPPCTGIELLDVRRVARLLDCSARHVFRLSEGGHMPPPLRLGSLVRWSRQALETWIAEGCPSRRSDG